MKLQYLKPTPALVAGLTAAAVLGTLLIMPSGMRVDSSQADSRTQIGSNIAPVKLNLKGLNPELLGIGTAD
jgi:hypothetical protein